MVSGNDISAPTLAETTDQKQRVREFFDHHEKWQGEIYAASSDPHARGVRRRISYVFQMLSALRNLPKGVALDVGCGPGAYLSELARRGYRCYGVDLSPEMLRACAEHLRNGGIHDVRLSHGDVENIPVGSECVGLLLCIGVLQYLDSPVQALKEIWRVTEPGGFVVMSFENVMSLSNIDWVIRTKLRALWNNSHDSHHNGLSMLSRWFLNHPNTPHHYRLYNPWKFERLVTSMGFTRVNAMTYGYEFRFLRRLKLLPEGLLNVLEIALERFLQVIRVPYLSYSGDYYVGTFQKRALKPMSGSTP